MNNFTGYAMDFVSYLSIQPDFSDNLIRRILFFGSAARNEATKESDIDIFIDCKTDAISKDITNILSNFLLSERISKWKRIGIENKINIIAGDLNSNKYYDLKRSFQDHAIVLWEKFSYVKESEDINPMFLIKWSTNAEEPKKRVAISRYFYGYVQNKKKYIGFLENTGSQKISDSVIIVQPQYINRLREFFLKKKVKYQATEIFIEKE